MTENVVVKGWRTRLEEQREQARDNVWKSLWVNVQYSGEYDFKRMACSWRWDRSALLEVRRLRNRARRVARSELSAEQLAELRAKHRAWHASWRSKPGNREKQLANAAAWQKANPEKARAKATRYKSTRRLEHMIYNQLLRLSKKDEAS